MATDEFIGKDYCCHFCQTCDGTGCIGEMPGMGGPNESRNFLLNCAGWERIRKSEDFIQNKFSNDLNNKNISLRSKIRLAPITGGVENIGYSDEQKYYMDMITSCVKAKVPVCIGDGYPDNKLQYGIEALKANKTKASVFIKPYPDSKLFERIEWAKSVSEYIGIDIDSYNIVTMRNLVHLEKKTPEQLIKIKDYLAHFGIPFIIKGVFNVFDIEMIKNIKPDIAYISNHGGRVDTRAGSTAEFLRIFHNTIKDNCGEIWIDGGIRTKRDIETACAYGASVTLMGRPFISALCRGGEKAVLELADSFSNNF